MEAEYDQAAAESTFNPYDTTGLFLCPPKASENCRFSDFFFFFGGGGGGYRKRALNVFIYNDNKTLNVQK